ncbi:MAG TPA: peroxiredoxin [Candidatus Binataceae bacterium]|nr:peroxiredoxin [Candidatus Binataceae bacterium]
MLQEGDPAPEFTLQAHSGAPLSLSNFRGKKVLLWFFPEADTPGCSLEGRGFRDHQEYFDENNIHIIGVSFDGVDRNAAFAKKYDFKFPLACDCNHQVALAYGACTDPRARAAERISFLIDEGGKIARVYDQVDPRDHPAKVLAEILDV